MSARRPAGALCPDLGSPKYGRLARLVEPDVLDTATRVVKIVHALSGRFCGFVVEGRFGMPGKFELYKDKAGKFRFRLKAGNGEIIAVSEAYESKAAAKNGIESVKKNAPTAGIIDQSAG